MLDLSLMSSVMEQIFGVSADYITQYGVHLDLS
jgi:hypothetical protein